MWVVMMRFCDDLYDDDDYDNAFDHDYDHADDTGDYGDVDVILCYSVRR